MLKLEPNLKRYPLRKNDLLQAWDSADELILEHLSNQTEKLKGRVLILGDSFGALTCALDTSKTGLEVTTYTDSYVSAQGIRINAEAAGLELPRIIHDLSDLKGTYDWVLARTPKNLSFFEDMLCRISAHLHADSKLVCGYMVKHQANSSFDLIAKYFGDTTTSLAKKKARLIFASFQRAKVTSPYPTNVSFQPADASLDKPFIHHSNLFAREKIDIGTRFLLEHIPQGAFKNILDLGCGNGVIGIAAKLLNPAAQIYFCDESAMAIQSAKANYAAYFSDSATFTWTNSFEAQPPGAHEPFDLILCNPPFHQGTTTGDFIAWQMFTDSHRVLKKDGLLRVIGNSGLHHPATLQRIFGNSEVVAKNPKFTIVDTYR